LEDCGYYPLDHLPADTLPAVLASLASKGETKIAIGLDMWDPHFLSDATKAWSGNIIGFGEPKLLLLEAADDAILRRFAETRRRHPLAKEGLSLPEAIARERAILEANSRAGHRIDTSGMNPNTLKAYVKSFLDLKTKSLDICIESFGFKHGAPSACDLVFDARCLPNPYYDKSLRPLTGKDEPVKAFFAGQEKPARMAEQIAKFVAEWTPDYERDHRSSLSIGIGCTGGQHRSVYVAELVATLLASQGLEARVLHREKLKWPAAAPIAEASIPKPKS
jgi:UPF0042 nucleotide-binding protein